MSLCEYRQISMQISIVRDSVSRRHVAVLNPPWTDVAMSPPPPPADQMCLCLRAGLQLVLVKPCSVSIIALMAVPANSNPPDP